MNTCLQSCHLQEAMDDMKQVASVTPQKKKQQGPARSPEKRKRGKHAGPAAGIRRRLFHSPKKRKRQREARVNKETEEPAHPSESEDADVFKGKYKQRKLDAKPPSPEFSDDRSRECHAEQEEEEEQEEDEELPAKLTECEPLNEHPGGPGPDSEGGLTLEEKVETVDGGLLSFLTEKGSKRLACHIFSFQSQLHGAAVLYSQCPLAFLCMRSDFEHFVDILYHEEIANLHDAFEAFGVLTGCLDAMSCACNNQDQHIATLSQVRYMSNWDAMLKRARPN